MSNQKSFKRYFGEGAVVGGMGSLVAYPFKIAIDPLTSGSWKEEPSFSGQKYRKEVLKNLRSWPRARTVLPLDLVKNMATLGTGWAVAHHVLPKLLKEGSFEPTKFQLMRLLWK